MYYVVHNNYCCLNFFDLMYFETVFVINSCIVLSKINAILCNLAKIRQIISCDLKSSKKLPLLYMSF